MYAHTYCEDNHYARPDRDSEISVQRTILASIYRPRLVGKIGHKRNGLMQDMTSHENSLYGSILPQLLSIPFSMDVVILSRIIIGWRSFYRVGQSVHLASTKIAYIFHVYLFVCVSALIVFAKIMSCITITYCHSGSCWKFAGQATAR